LSASSFRNRTEATSHVIFSAVGAGRRGTRLKMWRTYGAAIAGVSFFRSSRFQQDEP
jgi:hypothetical protein